MQLYLSFSASRSDPAKWQYDLRVLKWKGALRQASGWCAEQEERGEVSIYGEILTIGW
jgi:hypothetical protein